MFNSRMEHVMSPVARTPYQARTQRAAARSDVHLTHVQDGVQDVTAERQTRRLLAQPEQATQLAGSQEPVARPDLPSVKTLMASHPVHQLREECGMIPGDDPRGERSVELRHVPIRPNRATGSLLERLVSQFNWSRPTAQLDALVELAQAALKQSPVSITSLMELVLMRALEEMVLEEDFLRQRATNLQTAFEVLQGYLNALGGADVSGGGALVPHYLVPDDLGAGDAVVAAGNQSVNVKTLPVLMQQVSAQVEEARSHMEQSAVLLRDAETRRLQAETRTRATARKMRDVVRKVMTWRADRATTTRG